MSRVKRGKISLKRRRNVLKMVKGYRFGRSKKERQAKEAIVHAGKYSFAHRKDKKGDRRANWQIRISSALSASGISYSKFINMLKNKKISLDRKILAGLAQNNPKVFEKIVNTAK
ncbi:MAG: 50S ribosomal protein L20 [Candidatus Nomurabacteria bacterium GW2011_GWB1_37_5]|uniref:Large ribosomal subunit protein bL20 n=1 Tax=Candidatus Nomurabacteria bacterium GW2011_GWB1_37_5 TaxID=1618742 RepID=A0A0G0H754_9BACT|nr:MAG: 50S ribosomal protein L20 [Candidatus Nomurabacteria bacterium GW2011_GWB1_37_5]